jgi:spore maturation protein CgeB
MALKSFVSRWVPSKKPQMPSALHSLRVLHIGGYWRGPNDMVRHMVAGLEAAGARVLVYNTDQHPEALDTGNRPYDRGNHGPVWIRDENLQDQMTQFNPHVVVCNAGGLSFSPEAAERIRRTRYLLGIALSDPDVFQPTTRFIASCFDLFLTNDRSLVPEYKRLGVNALPLPLGTNEHYWHPALPMEKYKTDVLIIGRAHPDRIEPVREILRQFNTMVYGEGWEDYGITSMGNLYGEETLHALNSAGIVPVFLTNPGGTTMYVKIGVLDFVSAGALLVTNFIPDVEQYFTFGKEIIGFSTTEELISKIAYYLSHPEEAETIRKSGSSRARREHTWTSVWPKILSLLNR